MGVAVSVLDELGVAVKVADALGVDVKVEHALDVAVKVVDALGVAVEEGDALHEAVGELVGDCVTLAVALLEGEPEGDAPLLRLAVGEPVGVPERVPVGEAVDENDAIVVGLGGVVEDEAADACGASLHETLKLADAPSTSNDDKLRSTLHTALTERG